jgi:hypothetical protein
MNNKKKVILMNNGWMGIKARLSSDAIQLPSRHLLLPFLPKIP